MPFLSPTNSVKGQSNEQKNITFHELAHPKLTWGNFQPRLSGEGYQASRR